MKIGIIGAMDEEMELLRSRMVFENKYDFANQTFITGKLEKHDVILLTCGIGKVSSAIGATLLNQLFKPECIINTGSAGALGFKFKVGDIIISSAVCYHDVDLTVFGYKLGQMAKMPTVFIPDTKLVNIAEKCTNYLSNEPIKKSLIVSGDSFISDQKQIEYIKQNFSTDCIVEMEGCSIAQVCYLFNTPFIIIRSISDITEEQDNKITFQEFLPIAAQNSTNFVLQILREIKKHKNFIQK